MTSHFEVLCRNHQKVRIRRMLAQYARRRAELTSPTAPNGVPWGPDPLGGPAGYGLRGDARITVRPCRRRASALPRAAPSDVLRAWKSTTGCRAPTLSQRSGALARSHSTGNGPAPSGTRLPTFGPRRRKSGADMNRSRPSSRERNAAAQLALHTVAGRIEPRREGTQPALAG